LQFFSENSLLSLGNKFQFKPIKIFKDSSLAIMFSKSSKKFQYAHIDTPFFNPISLIENYASRMVKLFALRGDAGKRLNKLIQERQGKVGIFGAGRVLDYFVKYCNLNVKNKI